MSPSSCAGSASRASSSAPPTGPCAPAPSPPASSSWPCSIAPSTPATSSPSTPPRSTLAPRTGPRTRTTTSSTRPWPCSSPAACADSYSLNGARPPEPQAEALGQKLSEQGLTYEPISASGYTVTDPETDEDLPGLYALVGVPEQMPLDRAHALLTEACQDLEHPLQWVRLARDIGEAELAERHEELRQRYR